MSLLSLQPSTTCSVNHAVWTSKGSSQSSLGCCADKATLIVLMDFPPHAAAFMRLVWELHNRQMPGIGVTCVTPLELIDLKQVVTHTPSGRVEVLTPAPSCFYPSSLFLVVHTSWSLPVAPGAQLWKAAHGRLSCGAHADAAAA